MLENKILIIEDEKQMSDFIEMELTHEGYKVETAYDGKEGIDKVQNGAYDTILLDIMLPGLNGMEVCRRIRRFSNIPIIIITARGEIPDRVSGLDMGADDYLTKPFAIEELLARIRVTLRKKTNMTSQNQLVIDDLVINTASHKVTRKDKLIELTKKEYDLLEFLILNKGIVLSRDKLIENIWDTNFVGETNIVDVFIRTLRSKIDAGFETSLIKTVRNVGYIIEDENR